MVRLSHDCLATAGDLPQAPSKDSTSYDLLVLGAGVAGLISCIVGRQLGRRVALIEPQPGGSDSLVGLEVLKPLV